MGQRYYGDAGLRQAGEIALLIAPAMLDETCQLLAEAGYRISHPIDHFESRGNAAIFCITDNELELKHPTPEVSSNCTGGRWNRRARWPALIWLRRRTAGMLPTAAFPSSMTRKSLLHCAPMAPSTPGTWMKMDFRPAQRAGEPGLGLAGAARKARALSLRTRFAAGAGNCRKALELGSSASPCGPGWMNSTPPGNTSASSPSDNPAGALTNTPAGIFKRNRDMARFNDGPDCGGIIWRRSPTRPPRLAGTAAAGCIVSCNIRLSD